MFFYNTVTKEFPIFLGDAQVSFPDWDGNIQNPPAPLVWVEDVLAELHEDKVIEDAEPKLIDGVWTRQFTYRDLTAEEIEMRDAPKNAKAKLLELGLTELEIRSLMLGLIR